MERTPQKSPLPCFGLEHDRYAKECRSCPHEERCIQFMGAREGLITLDKVKFHILPKNYRDHTLAAYETDDPELPYLQRLYCNCYATVFRKNPTENVTRFKSVIASNANRVPCSVRMFLLSNMIAHELGEGVIIGHTEKARAAKFNGKMLTGELSIKRAKQYQDMCNKRYGTFALSSLEVLTGEDKDPIEATMLRSESTAAKWLVTHKIRNRASRQEALLTLYQEMELQLDPEWLALEDSYVDLILKPYVDKKIGTEILQRHRFNAFQVHSRYKRRPSLGRNAWLARQQVLPETLRTVLNNFNYAPGDFLYSRQPVTDAIDFWLEIGMTVRHNHCWRFISGEPSYFSERRTAILPAQF